VYRSSPAVAPCRGTVRHCNGESPMCQEVFGGKVLPHIVLGRDASEPSAWSSKMKGRPPLMCSPRASAVV
ncbi:unnamed protein product, partial [Bubo scandiacus]